MSANLGRLQAPLRPKPALAARPALGLVYCRLLPYPFTLNNTYSLFALAIAADLQCTGLVLLNKSLLWHSLCMLEYRPLRLPPTTSYSLQSAVFTDAWPSAAESNNDANGLSRNELSHS